MHWALALAMCLLIASAPFDIALSSLIWNPPVSAALIKMATAIALSLTRGVADWRRSSLTAALAWMARQAHLSAIFVAAPLLAALAARPLYGRFYDVQRSFSDRLKAPLLIAATILVLQIPFFVRPREPAAPAGPTAVIAG